MRCRHPTPGAPYTYVTTKHFLATFGLETLRDLPDVEALEDAHLLRRQDLLADPSPSPANEDLEPVVE